MVRLPLAFIGGLAAFALVPHIQANPVLTATFGGAAFILLAWCAALWVLSKPLVIDISLRPQHYLQAIAHASIFVYWGMYWPPIKDATPLILGQIVFAYAFDLLLSWTRHGKFTLGFGPFPIIFSTNLFLRFQDDWFYWQFIMVAVGFLAKDLIRWQRDGRRVHIFNPSSFPLALFSLVLILTRTSHVTWAEQIATLLILPPQIYLFIFLVSLPGQFLFGVTTMTLPAVLTTYGFSMLYLKLTGTYFFFDSNVPIAVFLGMHLLFTDPSTAPKSELGRILFGVCYGVTVVALYAVLDAYGAPTYYDKLLQVPLMNLLVKRFDQAGRSASLAWLNPARLGAAAAPRLRSAVYVSLWIIAFTVMSRAQGLNNDHPGHHIPFWAEACDANRIKACDNLAAMYRQYCKDGSPWACNELGILGATGKSAIPEQPGQLFTMSCGAIPAACENAAALPANARNANHHADPRLQDYLVVFALQPHTPPLAVFTKACDQGFLAGCGSVGDVYIQGRDVPRDPLRARSLWEPLCERGHAMSCLNLGVMHHLGDSVNRDDVTAARYLQRACDLGVARACSLVAELTGGQPAK